MTSRRSYYELSKRARKGCEGEQNLIWTSCSRWQHQTTKTSSEPPVQDDNTRAQRPHLNHLFTMTTTKPQYHRPNKTPEGTTPVKFHLQSPLHLDTSTLQPHFIASRVEATEEERPKANQEHLFKGRDMIPLKHSRWRDELNLSSSQTHKTFDCSSQHHLTASPLQNQRPTKTNSKIQDRLTGFNP